MLEAWSHCSYGTGTTTFGSFYFFWGLKHLIVIALSLHLSNLPLLEHPHLCNSTSRVNINLKGALKTAAGIRKTVVAPTRLRKNHIASERFWNVLMLHCLDRCFLTASDKNIFENAGKCLKTPVHYHREAGSDIFPARTPSGWGSVLPLKDPGSSRCRRWFPTRVLMLLGPNMSLCSENPITMFLLQHRVGKKLVNCMCESSQ